MDLDQRPPAGGKRRGLIWSYLRFAVTAPFACFGYRQIAKNAGSIRSLLDDIYSRPDADPRVRLDADSRLDVAEMAWQSRVSSAEVERQLGNRLRQTYQSTLFYLLGACLLLALALYHAIVTLPAMPTLSYFLSMISICFCFCSMAFYNALVNWQVRTRRLGSAREFLDTDETWWPSR